MRWWFEDKKFDKLHTLGDRLMVGQQPLKLWILVRFQVPQQPIFKKQCDYKNWAPRAKREASLSVVIPPETRRFRLDNLCFNCFMFQTVLQTLSNPALAWTLVVIATICETSWFVVLKKSGGLEVWPWNVIGFLIILIDVPLLSIALKSLPTGSVYAFWTGASAVAIALVGIFLFAEVVTFWRIFFITIATAGLIGINLTT